MRSEREAEAKSGFFRSRPRVAAAFLLVTSLLLSLVCLELAIRWWVPVRNVGPSFTVYDAEYGKRNKPNARIVRQAPEFRMVFSTDSRGFRGGEPGHSESGSLLFLGDSFTMGYGVSDGEEFPALIRSALEDRLESSGIEVLNAGVGNTGNGHWVKFLAMEAAGYKPSLIVFQLCENDFADNDAENLFEISATGELISVPVPPRGTLRTIQAFAESIPGLDRSYLFAFLQQIVQERLVNSRQVEAGPVIAADAEGSGAQGELTFRLIEEVIRSSQAESWPILFINVGIRGGHQERLANLLMNSGIPLIELPTKAERPDLYFPVDGHWNRQGHEFVAARVVEEINRMQVLGRAR